MSFPRFPLRLHTRVAAAFALLALLVAGTGSVATYAFSRWYLLNQRENSALTRAQLDARAVGAFLEAGGDPAEALSIVPSVGTAQPLLLDAGTWYTASVTVPPSALPDELLALGRVSGARQRIAIQGDPYFVVAMPTPRGEYVEVFSLEELDQILTRGGWLLVASSVVAAGIGAVVGATSVGRILGPVRRLEVGADRLAAGELSSRIELTGDPDIDPIARAFNGMASSVQSRIARERRFSANVSHELRSPLTAVLGTSELLADGRDRLPEREARLVDVLALQVRRMSQTLLDLLEISRVVSEAPLQWENTDLTKLCQEVLTSRGISRDLLRGDDAWIRSDARRLERIIGNLVENAQNHGGGLTEISLRQELDHVAIHIDDAGRGIQADERDRVFEPFARGADAHLTDGAGLGMAIAREQARILGGDIVIDTSPSGGARLTITLPTDEAR